MPPLNEATHLSVTPSRVSFSSLFRGLYLKMGMRKREVQSTIPEIRIRSRVRLLNCALVHPTRLLRPLSSIRNIRRNIGASCYHLGGFVRGVLDRRTDGFKTTISMDCVCDVRQAMRREKQPKPSVARPPIEE